MARIWEKIFESGTLVHDEHDEEVQAAYAWHFRKYPPPGRSARCIGDFLVSEKKYGRSLQRHVEDVVQINGDERF